MKRITIVSLLAILSLGIVSCGSETKSEKKPVAQQQTKAVHDKKFDDTAYKNVIAVLKEALAKEKQQATVENKLEAGRAFELVAKFIKKNMKEPRYGFTKDDLNTYKAAAMKRFNDVANSPVSSEDLKNQANAEKAALDNI